MHPTWASWFMLDDFTEDKRDLGFHGSQYRTISLGQRSSYRARRCGGGGDGSGRSISSMPGLWHAGGVQQGTTVRHAVTINACGRG